MKSISLNGDFHFLNEDGSICTEIGHTSAINAVGQIPGGFVTWDSNDRVFYHCSNTFGLYFIINFWMFYLKIQFKLQFLLFCHFIFFNEIYNKVWENENEGVRGKEGWWENEWEKKIERGESKFYITFIKFLIKKLI